MRRAFIFLAVTLMGIAMIPYSAAFTVNETNTDIDIEKGKHWRVFYAYDKDDRMTILYDDGEEYRFGTVSEVEQLNLQQMRACWWANNQGDMPLVHFRKYINHIKCVDYNELEQKFEEEKQSQNDFST